MLIAIEGADAAGKATQTKILVDRLRAAGITAESMSFPNYGTETGKLILRMLKGDVAIAEAYRGMAGVFGTDAAANALALQALMTANRYEQYEKLAYWHQGFGTRGQRFLEQGGRRVLVCDRYWLSGLVYGLADGLDSAWLLAVHAALPLAHHVVIDVDPAEALRRRPEARDRFERDREKQARVRDLYRAMWEAPPQVLRKRVHKVDGVGMVEEVAGRVWTVVEPLIRAGE